MKTPQVLAGAAASIVAALFLISPLVANAAGATWHVSVGNPGACTTADRNCATIQAAINGASSGDTIQIAAGTYNAFKVNAKANLTINGSGNTTIIAPTTLIDTGVGHKYTADMQVSAFVNDSTGISLNDMQIQGNGTAAPGAGGPDALLFWNASSGSVNGVNIQGTYTINGDQTGQGIAVDAGSGQTTNLTIDSSTISGFQKNGIDAIDGNGSTSNPGVITVDVIGGSITGAGSTSAIAQNGMLTWNRGGGIVTGNVNGTNISNLEYSPTPEAAGILAVGGASYSGVSNATFTNIDSYIDSASSGIAINATTGNTFDGVSPSSATGAQLATIENKMDGLMETSGTDAIFILPNTYIVTTGNLGISAGLAAATSGDTVLVTPGTYAGDVTLPASNNVTLEGIGGPILNLGSGYGINLDNNVSVTNFTFEGFTVNSSSGTTYAFKAYKANGLTLNNDTFNGAGGGTHDGGVDLNTTSNVILNNVISNGFYKNGFADTAAYTGADDSVSGNTITFNNITAENDGWTGISFYTVGGSGGSASINGVTFTGNNTISNDGAGIFLEGDSDANFATFATPANKITSDGTTLTLNNAAFSGNASDDIVNYQTAPVTALDATFGGLTGNQMNSSQRTTEDGKIIDHLDHSNLGLVTYYSPTITVTIDKFVDGMAASTTATTASFPMASSWNATNIGSGSGTYALSTTPFNSPNAYEAITSPMTSGADYATNEVTGGSVVGADCSGGQPFELAGYSFGNSFATAETATQSLTSPNFTNLVNDTYVIVWNKLCVPTPAITTPTNGLVVTGSNLTEVDWSSVTDAAGGITYTYQASNSPATNSDGSFATTVYSQGGISATSIPTSGTPDGTYYLQVQAKDADGNVSAWSPTVEVIVDSNPSVMTDAATGVTDTNSTLNGTDGGIDADNTSFWWGTTNAGPFTSGTAPVPPAGWNHDSGLGPVSADGQFNESFTTLTPGTTYYFAAWVEVGGTWYPGAVESFTTTGTAPTASVTTDAASSIDATDATLNGQNGAIASANTSFWWGTTATSSFTAAADPSSEFPAGWSHDPGLGSAGVSGSFSEPLTSLTPNTTYYFAAWSQVGGIWYPGAVLNFSTLPSANVTTNAATSITTSDAQLNGTVGPTDAGQVSFWVSTSTFDTSSPNIPANVYSTPVTNNVAANTGFSDQLSLVTTNGIVTGGVNQNMPAIQPNTTYYYVAWANVGGTWYPGAELSFTTGAATAPVISNEQISTTPTTATITWDTDHNSTSRVVYGTVHQNTGATNTCNSTPGNVSYECYGYSNSTDETNTPANTNGVIHHSVTVTGLSTGVTYFFRPVSQGSPETEGDELSGTPSTLPDIIITPGPQAFTGSVGVPFSQTFTANDGVDSSFTMSEDGNLPDGLATTTTGTTVTISGTPTTVSGPFDFDIDAASSTDPANFTSDAYSISISAAPPAAPTAVADNATTNMNTEVTIDVIGNDTGATGVTDIGVATAPQNGTATLDADGTSIDYTPSLNFSGTDTFTYDATGPGGTSATPATVTVTVKDTSTPVLTLMGDNPLYVLVNHDYNEPGVTITDPSDPSIDYFISVDGAAAIEEPPTFVPADLDTSVVGTHTLTYTATNNGGNTGSTTRTVIVLNPLTIALTSTSATDTTISDNPIPVTATFSGPVQGFTSGDITVTNGSADNVQLDAASTTATFDVLPSSNGAVTVTIPAGDVTSMAGDTNSNASEIDFTYAAAVSNPSSSNGGGGGGNGPIAGGGGGGGSTATALPFNGGAPTGQVLGASTSTVTTITPADQSCALNTPLITSFMRIGMQNNSAQVKALQQFLNAQLGLSIPVTGFFGVQTENGVKAFQLKYATDILTPWNLTKPTGFVYLTTQRWINLVNCSELNIPLPPLVPFQG